MGKKILSVINLIIILIFLGSFCIAFFSQTFDSSPNIFDGFILFGLLIFTLWLWIIEVINLIIAIFLFKKMNVWQKINKLAIILTTINITIGIISLLVLKLGNWSM